MIDCSLKHPTRCRFTCAHITIMDSIFPCGLTFLARALCVFMCVGVWLCVRVWCVSHHKTVLVFHCDLCHVVGAYDIQCLYYKVHIYNNPGLPAFFSLTLFSRWVGICLRNYNNFVISKYARRKHQHTATFLHSAFIRILDRIAHFLISSCADLMTCHSL